MNSISRSILARSLMTGVASLALMTMGSDGVRAETVIVQGDDGMAGPDGVYPGNDGDDGEPAAAAKAVETPTKTEAKTERPKVSLHLGKASAASVYATPYGSEPANIDPQTGRAIPPKSAA